MFTAIKERKSWAAAMMALLFGPTFGTAYLNKGKLAVYYFSIYILVLLIGANLPFAKTVFLIYWFVGAYHCFVIAKRQQYSHPLRWYSRWYALIPHVVLAFLLIITEFIAIYVLNCYMEPPTSDFYCGAGYDPGPPPTME